MGYRLTLSELTTAELGRRLRPLMNVGNRRTLNLLEMHWLVCVVDVLTEREFPP
jgi:hypothetical protein